MDANYTLSPPLGLLFALNILLELSLATGVWTERL
jgi:hypothetical protein